MALQVVLVCALIGLVSGQLPTGFQAMTATQKRDTVWNLILAGKYTTDPLPISNLPDSQLFNVSFLVDAFGQELDEMPPGRDKLVGTNGIAAKIEFNIYASSPYTGVFKANSSNLGIGRLSSNTAANLVSFWAMKLYVNGNFSHNFHMMHDVVGWGIPSVDYFQWNFWTQTPQPLQADIDAGRYSPALADAFTKCTAALPGGPLHRPGNIWGLGNVEQAGIDNQGVIPPKVIAPWVLQITPNYAIRPVTVKVATDDWRTVVGGKVPNNTLLYYVSAKASPCDAYVPLGEIWTRSEFVASSYHDKLMRFGQPYQQWDQSVAAPGVYCSLDPNALPTYPAAESALMETEAGGSSPGSSAQGNGASAISGSVKPGGVG